MIYLLIYFVVGLFLSLSLLLNDQFAEKRVLPFAITVVLWPLAIPIVLRENRNKALLQQGRHDVEKMDDPARNEDGLQRKALELLGAKEVEFSDVARRRIASIAEHGHKEVCAFADTADFGDVIDKLWDIGLHPKLYRSYLASSADLQEEEDTHAGEDVEVRFCMAMPEWYVGLSNEFVKSISKIDRKQQGKILEAIEKITAAPTQPVGNTIKPLTGDLKGFWRCRIGDYRLVYFPDKTRKQLVLVMFASRGEIYEKLPEMPEQRIH